MSLKTKANLKRREFTKEFKLKVLAELDSGMGLAQVARKYQVHANTIRSWRKQSRKYKDRAFAGRGKAYTDEARIAELERRMRVNDRILRYLTVRVDEDRRRADKFKDRRERKAAKRPSGRSSQSRAAVSEFQANDADLDN